MWSTLARLDLTVCWDHMLKAFQSASHTCGIMVGLNDKYVGQTDLSNTEKVPFAGHRWPLPPVATARSLTHGET